MSEIVKKKKSVFDGALEDLAGSSNPLTLAGIGVISGLQGAMGEKQRKAEIEQAKFEQIANNEQNTQMRRSAAIQSLAANISNSLLR